MNFKFSLKIYPAKIMVSVGQSDKQLQKSLRKGLRDQKGCFMPEGCGAYCVTLEPGLILIRFKEISDTAYSRGVVAHEIFHAVHFVMDWIDHSLGDRHSGEPFAYLTEYITRKLYQGESDNRP